MTDGGRADVELELGRARKLASLNELTSVAHSAILRSGTGSKVTM